jgi:DNA polymerase III epsilon subunit-like protein
MSVILWYDVETSGLNLKQHKILSFSYIITKDNEILEKDTYFINHDEILITKGAYNVNKIPLEALFTSEYTEIALIDKIKELIDKYGVDTYAGYNIYKFDFEFIKDLFRRYDQNVNQLKPRKLLDVYLIVKEKKLHTFNNKLETICEHFNIPIDAHKSESDIMATYEVYKKLGDLIG